jgi:hypothetical protein
MADPCSKNAACETGTNVGEGGPIQAKVVIGQDIWIEFHILLRQRRDTVVVFLGLAPYAERRTRFQTIGENSGSRKLAPSVRPRSIKAVI